MRNVAFFLRLNLTCVWQFSSKRVGKEEGGITVSKDKLTPSGPNMMSDTGLPGEHGKSSFN